MPAKNPNAHYKPTKADLAAAHGKRVPDIIAPDLKVLFVGINPGLYTAAIGHHFGRPGNRFWPALHAGGFTKQLVSPFDEHKLLARGYGITNLVSRATNMADELDVDELRKGARKLIKKVQRFAPRVVAVLGLTSYRVAFQQPRAKLGPQEETIAGVHTWLLPNPSGVNAHFTPKDYAWLFRKLRAAAEAV